MKVKDVEAGARHFCDTKTSALDPGSIPGMEVGIVEISGVDRADS